MMSYWIQKVVIKQVAHWLVEKRLRRPLKVPVFDQAIEALDEALSNIVIDPEEIKNG